ncbi:MAG: hypothetical protein ACKOSS_00470 [Planctomycetia bacterium]
MRHAARQAACLTAPRGCLALLLALLSLVARPAHAAWADPGDYRVTDSAAVYLGNARLFARPCVVRADRVYREIPEYREILEHGLTDKDPRYHFLMKKASEKFLDAVRQMARDLDHDLVAEVGAVKATKDGVAEAPERTSDVVSRLR